MEQLKSKKWWTAAGTRAIKTIAQTAIASIGTAAIVSQEGGHIGIDFGRGFIPAYFPCRAS